MRSREIQIYHIRVPASRNSVVERSPNIIYGIWKRLPTWPTWWICCKKTYMIYDHSTGGAQDCVLDVAATLHIWYIRPSPASHMTGQIRIAGMIFIYDIWILLLAITPRHLITSAPGAIFIYDIWSSSSSLVLVGPRWSLQKNNSSAIFIVRAGAPIGVEQGAAAPGRYIIYWMWQPLSS